MQRKQKTTGRLPLYFIFGIIISFFLGLINSPNNFNYVKQSIIPSIGSDTVYVEKVVEVVKVDTQIIIQQVESISNVKSEKLSNIKVKSNSVPTKEIKPKDIEEGNTTIINDDFYAGRSYGYNIRNKNATELRKFLTTNGFRNLNNASLYQMRRMWMAYQYEGMLMNLHLLTEFPVSMLYAFFIIEATTNGVETNLWRLDANAGGMKAFKGYGSTTYKTYEIINGKRRNMKAKFMKANNTKEGIEAWAKVLNSGRYYDCKKANYSLPKKELYESICKCVYESGYHTDPKYKFRAQFMAEFWKMKIENFPKVVLEEF